MKKELANKLTLLITSAFGLVAALAWNEAVRSLFVEGGVLHILATYGVWVYAVVASVIAVIVVVAFDRISKILSG
ncbi:MAG: DUF5654 family protein [archaeon]